MSHANFSSDNKNYYSNISTDTTDSYTDYNDFKLYTHFIRLNVPPSAFYVAVNLFILFFHFWNFYKIHNNQDVQQTADLCDLKSETVSAASNVYSSVAESH